MQTDALHICVSSSQNGSCRNVGLQQVRDSWWEHHECWIQPIHSAWKESAGKILQRNLESKVFLAFEADAWFSCFSVSFAEYCNVGLYNVLTQWCRACFQSPGISLELEFHRKAFPGLKKKRQMGTTKVCLTTASGEGMKTEKFWLPTAYRVDMKGVWHQTGPCRGFYVARTWKEASGNCGLSFFQPMLDSLVSVWVLRNIAT